jgi:hypothetical protein
VISVTAERESCTHSQKVDIEGLKASNDWMSNFKLAKLLSTGGTDKGTVTQNN